MSSFAVTLDTTPPQVSWGTAFAFANGPAFVPFALNEQTLLDASFVTADGATIPLTTDGNVARGTLVGVPAGVLGEFRLRVRDDVLNETVRKLALVVQPSDTHPRVGSLALASGSRKVAVDPNTCTLALAVARTAMTLQLGSGGLSLAPTRATLDLSRGANTLGFGGA